MKLGAQVSRKGTRRPIHIVQELQKKFIPRSLLASSNGVRHAPAFICESRFLGSAISQLARRLAVSVLFGPSVNLIVFRQCGRGLLLQRRDLSFG